MTSDTAEDRRLVWGLYLCSLASGAAALAYEVSWTRLLALTFGSTTLAASAAVAAFMGGMGVGAWLYHRAGARAASALRLYAVLELGIAASAFALTPLLERLPALFAGSEAFLPGGFALASIRYALVFCMLLLPAGLMGATFPALCAVLIRQPSGVGRHLGTLYGLNTIGAAGGALAAGLVGIEVLGLRGTVSVGVNLNLLVAAGAFALSTLEQDTGPAASTHAAQARPNLATALPRPLIGAVLFGSGLATLSYEILWFRALRYLFGNSTYALTIMLVVFLTGLGVGSLFLRRVARARSPELALASCQLGIGVLAILSIGACSLVLGTPLLESQISVFSPLAHTRAWTSRLLIDAVTAFSLLLPATLLMGLAFPLASALYLGDARKVGARVGQAVLLSNTGSILGSLLGAVAWLPWLGTVGGTRLVAGFNLALGCALLAAIPGAPAGRLARGGIAIALAIGLVWALPERMNLVGLRTARSADARLVFEEEGDLATVQVWQHPKHPERMGVAIDGTVIGSTPLWNRRMYAKQVLLAHLPMVLDASLRTTLNVGLGSGSTLEALASYPEIERLDAVEINAGVFEAAKLFPEARVFDDPRVKVSIDDALHFLLRSTERYDLIVADGKQGRSFSGNARMLSQELYALALAHLSERGMLVQWINTVTPHVDFRVILRTFSETFPETEVFFDPPGAVLLVGSRAPLAGRTRMTQASFDAGRVREDLARLRIGSVEEMLSRWVTGADVLRRVAAPGINTWDHPILEFTSYRTPPTPRDGSQNCELLLRARRSGRSRTGAELAPEGAPRTLSMDLVHRAYCDLFVRSPRADAAVAAALEADPGNPAALALQRSLRE